VRVENAAEKAYTYIDAVHQTQLVPGDEVPHASHKGIQHPYKNEAEHSQSPAMPEWTIPCKRQERP
jgi:hypothetical protein